eukprot:2691406-Rhodomonas_salina.2
MILSSLSSNSSAKSDSEAGRRGRQRLPLPPRRGSTRPKGRAMQEFGKSCGSVSDHAAAGAPG